MPFCQFGLCRPKSVQSSSMVGMPDLDVDPLGCIIIVFGGRSSYIDPRNESGTDNIRPKFGDSWTMPPILPSADLSSSVRSLSVFTL